MKKTGATEEEIWQCHRFIAIGTRMRNELQKRWKMAAVLMPREVLQHGCPDIRKSMPGYYAKKDMTSEIVRAMMKYARGLVSPDISSIYFFSNVI